LIIGYNNADRIIGYNNATLIIVYNSAQLKTCHDFFCLTMLWSKLSWLRRWRLGDPLVCHWLQDNDDAKTVKLCLSIRLRRYKRELR